MVEHTPKSRTNSGIRNINLVSNYASSFSIGLTQEDVVIVVSNPIQSKKSGSSKEIRSKFHNDPVKMTEILKKKRLTKTPSPKDQKIKKKYEKKRKVKEVEELSKVDGDVQNSSADESEEDSEEEAFFCCKYFFYYLMLSIFYSK